MKTGWFRISESKYIPVRMVAGPYPWGNAVRLRTDSGEEIITTMDCFHAERPLTPKQIAFAEHRAAQFGARVAKERARQEWVAAVLAVLASGPKTLRELHEETGYWWGPLWQRIHNWSEFWDVKFDDGKYHYDH